MELLHFKLLSQFDNLIHFQTTREGGVSTGSYASLNMSYSTGDSADAVLRNRELLAQAVSVNLDRFVFTHQTHGCRVMAVGADDCGSGVYGDLPEMISGIDSLVSNQQQVMLCIRVADCIPILCYDPRQRVIAAVHAGWQGTALGIVGNSIDTMVHNFGSVVSDILVVIGVGAGVCCYEVDENVVISLRNSLPPQFRSSFFREKGNGKFMVDLKAVNRIQLETVGIAAQNIEVNNICSICNSDRFFSHRAARSGDTGRMSVGIMLI